MRKLPKELKVVRIFPREYWKEHLDSRGVKEGENITVNDTPFKSALECNIQNSMMVKFFGTVQKVYVFDDAVSVPDDCRRGQYFVRTDEYDSNQHEWEWDLCCIQEEYEKEDFPELFL
jgi:hypothetical protein